MPRLRPLLAGMVLVLLACLGTGAAGAATAAAAGREPAMAAGAFADSVGVNVAPGGSETGWALADLVARLAEAGGRLIDVQMVTPHLASLGARDLPRAEFLALLATVRDQPVRLAAERLPVARLGRRALG